ncbi:MAG: hypothetical protein WA194_06755 [Patescibacteria group bacterium]
MNATPIQKDWADALTEATTSLVAETRQEKAILTGNYAGSVEAILMDMDVHEKLEKVSENLDSAYALMQFGETRDRATEAYSSANILIHELENVQLTGSEKNKLFHLTNRLIEIGLEFAVPAHTMEEHADMKCPA